MTINIKLAVLIIWIIPLSLGVMVKKSTGLGGELREVRKNGMTFRWAFEGDRLQCQLEAPAQGWLAVGFNPKSGLTETSLIMGAVHADGRTRIEDHWIIAPGFHRPVTELEQSSALADVKGWQNAKGSSVSFSLPLKAASKFHHDLTIGDSYHLLLAYSRSDDFDHHSSMRSSIEIKL